MGQRFMRKRSSIFWLIHMFQWHAIYPCTIQILQLEELLSNGTPWEPNLHGQIANAPSCEGLWSQVFNVTYLLLHGSFLQVCFTYNLCSCTCWREFPLETSKPVTVLIFVCNTESKFLHSMLVTVLLNFFFFFSLLLLSAAECIKLY